MSAKANPSLAAALSGLVRTPRITPAAAVLTAGLAAIVIATLLSLAQQHWSTSNGAHAPIILVTGLWLVWREREHIRFAPGAISAAWLALLAPLLLIYAYARSFGLLGSESASLYAILLLFGFYYWGPRVMRRLWFAILYLGFLIKPSYGVVAELTQPLKIAISTASVDVLAAFGYPVASTGVVIQMAQYELLVQQACAGLASLLTLMAMGLLYVHLTRSSGYARPALLLLAIVPIAMLANLLRVILLLLLTYYFGDAVAQSLAHDAAGMVTFFLSMFGMFAFDALLGRFFDRASAR